MNKLDNIKKKRFKMAIYTSMFLGVLAIFSIHKDMSDVASTCVAGILTITTMFIGSDGYRPSTENTEN